MPSTRPERSSSRPSARPTRRSSRPAGRHTDGTGIVLVADDDPIVLHVTQHRLRHAGYRVVTARTAPAVLRILEDESPRLVLLDVLMPGSAGTTLLVELEQSHRMCNVVLHSAIEGARLEALAQSSGALGAIQKTGDTHKFLADFHHFWSSTAAPTTRPPSTNESV